jgi:hypothetical protein
VQYRSKIFTTPSPIPRVIKDITLYEDTWDAKIVPKHPEMQDRVQDVEATTISSTSGWESLTVQGNLVFVNESVVDSTGRVLRVAVMPVGICGEVRSAYFSSNLTPGKKIWP